MKKTFLFLIIVVLLFSLSACGNNLNEEELPPPEEKILPEITEQVEDVMSERLITADELLEYIQTHDVGLSSDDFNGIDIDDFISYWSFRPSSIDLLWEKSLESYLEHLVFDERAVYMATEKFSVESTDEEYKKFIEEFFNEINKEVVSSNKAHGFYWYDINNDGKQMTLYITQTKGIDNLVFLDLQSTYPELLEVFVADGPDGAGTSGNLCYSKNKKYMMLANLYDEKLFEYVKVFCEIED